MSSGDYKITFKKDGYISYTEKVHVGVSDLTLNAILAKDIPKGIDG